MRRDPHGHVVFIKGRKEAWTSVAKQRMKASMRDTFERVHFVPRVAGSIKFLQLLGKRLISGCAQSCTHSALFSSCCRRHHTSLPIWWVKNLVGRVGNGDTGRGDGGRVLARSYGIFVLQANGLYGLRCTQVSLQAKCHQAHPCCRSPQVSKSTSKLQCILELIIATVR